jgi:hypothetical protein
MKFDDETTDVLIGGYLSTDAAHDDYEAVLASGGYLHGACCASRRSRTRWASSSRPRPES